MVKISQGLPDAYSAVGWDWYDLSTYVEDDNKTIRAKGNAGSLIQLNQEELMAGLESNGWDTKFIPPIVNDSGELQDGRQRCRSMIALGQRYVPVLVVTIDKPEENARAAASVMNIHPTSTKRSIEDLVVSMLADYYDGHYEADNGTIEKRLITKYEIWKSFRKNSGILTKVTNIIKRRIDEDDANIRRKPRNEWIQWLKDEANIDLKKDNILLYRATAQASKDFCMDRFLDIGKRGGTPKIILYVDVDVKSKARDRVDAFIDEIKSFQKDVFGYVSSYVFTGVNKGTKYHPPKKSIDIVGIIPQASTELEKEYYERGKLLTRDQFNSQD
jgi:hypothetical protein